MKEKAGSVFFETSGSGDTSGNGRPLLSDEIKGANCLFYELPKGCTFDLKGGSDCVKIFILLDGSIEFDSNNKAHFFDTRSFFAPNPEKNLGVRAIETSRLLEVDWAISEKDLDEMESFKKVAPFMQNYSEATLYDDDSKSPKTLSRSILLQHVLPRICMGSVEATGFDRVEFHKHPYVDQFFYTFAENDMDLLVEDERHHIGGDILLHIPLGSSHGAEVATGKKLHYIWIDFVINDKGLSYLDETHKLRTEK